MSPEPRAVVRDFRPEDREAAIDVLAASFAGFGPLDQVVGDDDQAQDRRRRMYEMILKEGAKQAVMVAERDGRIEGVLTYARLRPQRPRQCRGRANRGPEAADPHP
jgi:hypothetical protein